MSCNLCRENWKGHLFFILSKSLCISKSKLYIFYRVALPIIKKWLFRRSLVLASQNESFFELFEYERDPRIIKIEDFSPWCSYGKTSDLKTLWCLKMLVVQIRILCWVPGFLPRSQEKRLKLNSFDELFSVLLYLIDIRFFVGNNCTINFNHIVTMTFLCCNSFFVMIFLNLCILAKTQNANKRKTKSNT